MTPESPPSPARCQPGLVEILVGSEHQFARVVVATDDRREPALPDGRQSVMTTPTRAALLLMIIAGLATAASPFGGATAHASCMQSPLASPYHFTGTVTTLSNAGRTATARTDDGRTVIVLGSEADEPNAATSVDRTYEVGAKYEFHPLNDTSPYRDNACTATHLIGASSPGPSGLAAAAGSGTASGEPSTSLWAAMSAAAILLSGAGLWLLRRRTSKSTTGFREETTTAEP